MSRFQPAAFPALLCLLAALALAPACGRRDAPAPTPVVEESVVTIVEVEPVATPTEKAPPARSTWTPETTVGQIVAEAPGSIRVFELVKIDYCCGGNRTIADAAKEKGVEAEALLGALSVVGTPQGGAAAIRWDQKPLAELVQHIVDTHHVFLRRELPRLTKIVATVERVHGENHPELAEIKETFGALHEELIPHLVHEEEVVFPAVHKLVAGERTAALETSLKQMRGEHDAAGAAIHKLRRLTQDYTPPEDACTLYKQMLAGLLALEKDTLQHVHLENNVLLPRCTARN